jgi:hypothetical protein
MNITNNPLSCRAWCFDFHLHMLPLFEIHFNHISKKLKQKFARRLYAKKKQILALKLAFHETIFILHLLFFVKLQYANIEC